MAARAWPYKALAADGGKVMIGLGGTKALVTCVVCRGWFSTWVPTALLTLISPTCPPGSANKVIVLAVPSCPARPATEVPRIPIVTTGVLTDIASEPTLEISPLTKENTPCTTLKVALPVLASAS